MYCTKCGFKLAEESKFCPKCGEELINKLEKNKINDEVILKNTEKVDFFIVPTTRLVIFSILSFGFYSVYWFSLNFSAIEKRRKARNQKTHTTLWAFFNTLTSEILFKELSLIKKEATGKGFKTSPAILGVIYFIFMVFGGYILLSPFVFIYTALTFQKKVKEYNVYGLSSFNKAKFNWREIVVVTIGMIFFVISFASGMAELEESGVNENNKEVPYSSEIVNNKDEFTQEVLQSVAIDANKELPKMLDSETRLDSVSAINKGLNYNYTLVNFNKTDLADGAINDTLKADMIKSMCASPDMKFYTDNKAIMKYSYYDKNNVFIESIIINTGTDCELTFNKEIKTGVGYSDSVDIYNNFDINVTQDDNCNIEKNIKIKPTNVNLSEQDSEKYIILSFNSGKDLVDIVCPDGYYMNDCSGEFFNGSCRLERYNYDEQNDEFFCKEFSASASCSKK